MVGGKPGRGKTVDRRQVAQTRAMAFDSTDFAAAPKAAAQPAAPTICPIWAAENPDRALALLFVAPQDCDAVDVLTAH